MLPKSLSRWTMTYFAAAFVCFVLAQVLIVAGLAYPQGGIQAPPTLMAVHLLTIGWLTLLMFGALYQFVPVITAGIPVGDGVAGVTLIAIVVGLAGMLLGFLGLGGGLKPFPWLPVGGTLVVVGVVSTASVFSVTLWRARPLTLAARFVAAALGFLLVTVGLGLTMALALTQPQLFGGAILSALFARGLALHVGVGIAGWFTLTAMGVGYKLLAMFSLAPEERGALGDWAFHTSAGGLAVVALAGIGGLWFYPAAGLWRLAEGAGWASAAVGIVLYLVDMWRLYSQRRRRILELNGAFAAWALVALALGVVMWALLAALGAGESEMGPVAYLLIFGWLSGLGLSQLYKIVPFLTWIERFGGRLGKGPVPRVQDLVNESRARPWFILYFVAVALGVVAGMAELTALWRLAAVGVLAGTLAIGVELWRARHAEPVVSGPVPPV